jgi:hypothetical protein
MFKHSLAKVSLARDGGVTGGAGYLGSRLCKRPK